MCVDAVGSVKCFEWSIRFEKCSTNAVHLPFSAIRVQIRMLSIRDIESTFTFRLKSISKMLRSSFTDPTSYCQLDFLHRVPHKFKECISIMHASQSSLSYQSIFPQDGLLIAASAVDLLSTASAWRNLKAKWDIKSPECVLGLFWELFPVRHPVKAPRGGACEAFKPSAQTLCWLVLTKT